MIISATKTNNIYLLSLKFNTPSSQIIWSPIPFFGCTKMKSSSKNLINKILSYYLLYLKSKFHSFCIVQINDGNFGNMYIIACSL